MAVEQHTTTIVLAVHNRATAKVYVTEDLIYRRMPLVFVQSGSNVSEVAVVWPHTARKKEAQEK